MIRFVMFNALIVDDDINVAVFISRLLEKRFNCKVETASDGSEALSKLNSFEPEIIFLDVTMPVMDGLQTMEAIKATRFKDVPVVMITAISEKDVVVKAMGMGALAYILKPLVFMPVYEKIKEVFRKIKSDKNIVDNKTYSNKELFTNKILVIGKDKSFIDRITSRVDDKIKILNSETGIDGLALFSDEKPKVVIISDLIEDINADLLVDRIKKINEEVSVFVLKENEKLTVHENKLWETINNKIKI